MKGYLEEVGHLTKLNPQDAWLPITESRNGNAHYAAFHNLNAGVGFQALVLPIAFAYLGWYVFFICRLHFVYCYTLDFINDHFPYTCFDIQVLGQFLLFNFSS